jgi:hypothetical protein
MISPQMDFEHPTTSSLAAILESATEFGVSPNEIWEAVVTTPDHLPTDVKARYIEEISAELARRLLEKQRAT